MVSVLYQIAKNTFRENLREPIFLIVLLTALVMIGILPTLTLFVFREQIKLVVDSAMATMLFFGWILAVLSATHAIAEELHSGTANLLLAKPVNRPVFILGKIVGILAGLTVFCLLAGLATLIAVRVAKDQFRFDQLAFAAYFAALALSCVLGGLANFIRRSSFCMSTILGMLVLFPVVTLVIRWLPADGQVIPYSWPVVPALLLIGYAVWMMGILATALSTRLALIPNLLVCAVIFMLGLVTDYLLGRAADGNAVVAMLYAAIPNWQLFWMADALAAEKLIPLAYLLWATAYVVMFCIFFLALAVLLFHNREVGKESIG